MKKEREYQRCTQCVMDTSDSKITFDESQRAVAPGQSAVLYNDGVIIGGGVIARTIK